MAFRWLAASDKCEFNPAADDGCGALKGLDRHIAIGRVKHAINLRPAGVHQQCQSFLANLAFAHCPRRSGKTPDRVGMIRRCG
jgi:hypothetical protein